MKHLIPCVIFTLYLFWLYYETFMLWKRLKFWDASWSYFIVPALAAPFFTVAVGFVYYIEYLKYSGAV